MTREAEFRSKCAACGESIDVGDLIVRDDDLNWVHEDCADDDDDGRSLRFNLAEEARDA